MNSQVWASTQAEELPPQSSNPRDVVVQGTETQNPPQGMAEQGTNGLAHDARVLIGIEETTEGEIIPPEHTESEELRREREDLLELQSSFERRCNDIASNNPSIVDIAVDRAPYAGVLGDDRNVRRLCQAMKTNANVIMFDFKIRSTSTPGTNLSNRPTPEGSRLLGQAVGTNIVRKSSGNIRILRCMIREEQTDGGRIDPNDSCKNEPDESLLNQFFTGLIEGAKAARVSSDKKGEQADNHYQGCLDKFYLTTPYRRHCEEPTMYSDALLEQVLTTFSPKKVVFEGGNDFLNMSPKAFRDNERLQDILLSGNVSSFLESPAFCQGLTGHSQLQTFELDFTRGSGRSFVDHVSLHPLKDFLRNTKSLRDLTLRSIPSDSDHLAIANIVQALIDRRQEQNSIHKFHFDASLLVSPRVLALLKILFSSGDNYDYNVSGIQQVYYFGGDDSQSRNFGTLAPALVGSPALEGLRLAFLKREHSSQNTERLRQIILENPALKRLKMVWFQMTDHAESRVLSDALAMNDTLEDFQYEFSSGSVDAGYLLESLSRTSCENGSLRRLGVPWIGIQGDHLNSLTRAIAVRDIEELDISKNRIGDIGAIRLASFLKDQRKSSTLKRLILESTGIDSKGAAAIFSALTENTTLRELNIRHNNIDARGFTVLSQALPDIRGLTRLFFSWDEGIRRGLRASLLRGFESNRTLIEVRMGNVRDTDFARIVEHCTQRNHFTPWLTGGREMNPPGLWAHGFAWLAGGKRQTSALHQVLLAKLPTILDFQTEEDRR